MNKKVMVGMSGGVDSSVAALKLKNMGYDVTGITLVLHSSLSCSQKNKFFSNDSKNVLDAQSVCRKIGIEHIVFDFSSLFENEVINDFVRTYKQGLTPNPCVVCNKKIKFGALLSKAESLGFDFIATGHYAVSKFNKNLNRYLLYASDSSKDQSYMLYNMTQHQLKHTIFPLCNMEKSNVRDVARKNNLDVADKSDSQEICFVTDGDYASFIQRYSNEKSLQGDFVDESGNVLGKHKGIIYYTVGQRRGLGVCFQKPMYVLSVNPVDNTVVLGDEEKLYSSYALVDNVNFIPFDDLEKSLVVDTKIRYKANTCKARIFKKDGRIIAKFEKQQKSVTPGQSIVFYMGNVVIGGGIISRV